MQHYFFEDHILKLRVKKAPIAIRAILFLFAFAFFLFPVTGMILSISSGNGFHIGFIIGIAVFSLLGFYLLKIALWNTQGQESILIQKNKISYEAHYGWFSNTKKSIEFEELTCSILPIGYEEDQQGVLILGNESSKIECAVKMPKKQLEKLIPIIEAIAKK